MKKGLILVVAMLFGALQLSHAAVLYEKLQICLEYQLL